MNFETEITSHRAVLFTVAMRHARNHADAEDLVQDTLTHALASKALFEGTNALPWLCHMLRNLLINKARRASRFCHADPQELAWFNHGGTRRHQPDLPGFSDEIRAAARELPNTFAEALHMCDVQDMGYQDIADVLGLPLGTVMSRIHRARTKMRAPLAEHALNAGIIKAVRRRVGVRLTGATMTGDISSLPH